MSSNKNIWILKRSVEDLVTEFRGRVFYGEEIDSALNLIIDSIDGHCCPCFDCSVGDSPDGLGMKYWLEKIVIWHGDKCIEIR